VPLNPAPVRRPGPAYPLRACTSQLRPRQSGCGAIFRCPTLLWEGTCLLEGQTSLRTLLSGALTLDVSRGVLTGRFDHLAAPCYALARSVGKAAKRTIGRVLVSYRASGD